MTDIVEFLRARLDEDEQVARSAIKSTRGEEGEVWVARYHKIEQRRPGDYHGRIVLSAADGDTPRADHIARWDPARVLAEVESKRRILDEVLEFVEAHQLTGSDPEAGLLDRVVGLLALPHHDHADFDESWKL